MGLSFVVRLLADGCHNQRASGYAVNIPRFHPHPSPLPEGEGVRVGCTNACELGCVVCSTTRSLAYASGYDDDYIL